MTWASSLRIALLGLALALLLVIAEERLRLLNRDRRESLADLRVDAVGIESPSLQEKIPAEPTVNYAQEDVSSHVYRREEFETVLQRVIQEEEGAKRRKVLRKPNIEVSAYEGYVLVQVESRLGGNHGNGSDTLRTAMTHNYVLTKKFGYEYCFFIGPNQVHHPDGSVATGYWTKVQFIYLALHVFPRAKGILYLDSDAYFGNRSIEVFLSANAIDLDKTPIVLVQETSHWFRALNSFNYPQLYDYPPVNSGALLLNPRHEASKAMVKKWLLESTLEVSALELYCRCITVRVRCDGRLLRQESIMKTLQSAYALKHPGHFHKCAKNLRVRWGSMNDSSVEITSGNDWSYNIRAITSVSEFDRVLQYSSSRELRKIIKHEHCPDGIRSFQVTRFAPELDFLHRDWPGDQERLQWVIGEFKRYTTISPALADQWLFGEHSKHMDLSGCRRGRKCLAYHPCANHKVKVQEAETIFKVHAPTTWAAQFPDTPAEDIINSAPTFYFGRRYTVDWSSWRHESAL